MKNLIRFPNRHRPWSAFLAIALSILFGYSDHAMAQSFGAGTFQGIIQSGSDNDEGFGFITLTLTRSGAFSMRFNVGVNNVGQHFYVKSGKFDADGHYHVEGKPVTNTRYEIPRFIDLQLDSTDSPTRITGMLTDLTHSSDIEIEKIVVNGGKAGSYALAVSNDNDGAPTGTGNGRVNIDRRGHLVVSGRVPGGRPFSQTANLTVYDRWPVFAKMAGTTNGILSGWITVQDSTFDGQLIWLGPEVPGPNHAFVPAFVTDVSVNGRRTR